MPEDFLCHPSTVQTFSHGASASTRIGASHPRAIKARREVSKPICIELYRCRCCARLALMVDGERVTRHKCDGDWGVALYVLCLSRAEAINAAHALIGAAERASLPEPREE